MKRIIGLLMLVIVVTVCFTGCSSYTDPIDTAIRITYYGETEKVKLTAPEEYIEWYEDRYSWNDFEEDFYYGWEDDFFTDRFGEGFKVTYKLVEKQKVDKATLQLIKDYFSEEYGIPAGDVKKAYSFDIEYLIKGSENVETDEDYDMYSVKIRDKWYLVDRYFDGRFEFTCEAW